MQNAALLLGIVAVTACSIDHVTLAALDQASAGAEAEGGAAGDSAGTSSTHASAGGTLAGASPGAAGAITSAGSQSGGAAGAPLNASGGSIGSEVFLGLAGEAGAGSVVLCSCLGSTKGQLCGSDGITYPNECSDAGTCLPPAIDCWHACPCVGANTDPTGAKQWFPLACASSAPCTDGVSCLIFNQASPDTQTTCTSAGN